LLLPLHAPIADGAVPTTLPSGVTQPLVLAPAPGNPRNSEGDFIALKDGRVLFVYTHFTGGGADHAAAHLAARTTADGSLPPRPATPPSGTGGPSGEWAPPNGRTGGPAGEPSGEWAPPTDRAGAAPSGDAIPAAGPVGPIGDEPTRVDTGDAWAAPTARHDQPSGDRWPANGGDEPTRVESDRTLVRPSAPGGPGDGPSGDRWAPPPAGRGDEPRDRGPSRPGVGAGAAAGMAAAGAAGVAAGGPSEMALASGGTDLGARPRYGREATPSGPSGPGSGEYVPGHASGYAGDDGPRKRRLVPLVGAIAAVGLIGAAAAVALSGGDDPEDTGSETTSDTTAAPSPTTEPTAETLPTTLSIGAERRVFDGSSANVEGFTFDDEGNLWAAAQQGGFVSEVTAPSDEATYETIPFTNDAGENAKPVTAVNSGGYIWAALRTDSAVARIDPTTHEPVSVPAPERPVFLYAAEDGYIYGISEGPQGDEDPTGTMFKLDPTGGDDGTGAVVAEVSLDSPRTLVVDGDNLWVTYGGSLVRNFDTNLSPVGVEITVGNGSESILSDAVTVDDEGYVWTANRNEATVSRIDPESESVTGTFDVGGEPSDIEFDGARMWIVDTGDAEIPGHLKLFDASDAANGNVPLVTSIEVGLRPLDMYISDAVSDGVWVSVTQERDFSMVRVDATA
jgi:streptogramin lyase